MSTACTTSSVLEPYDSSATGPTGSKATLRKKGKRRHSLHHARRFSEFIEDDSVMLKMVCLPSVSFSVYTGRHRMLILSARLMTF